MLKILFIGLVWPEPTSSAAGWRILHLVKLLLQRYEVHFACAASKSPHSYDLQRLGVIEASILLNDSSFDDYVKALQPYAVVFDRFMVEEQYGWRVAEAAPEALRILDTEDLHFLRSAREESFKKGTAINYYNAIAKREIASIIRSDVALIISHVEMTLLTDTFKVDKERLLFLPFQEEKLDLSTARLSFVERTHFVFIGNFIHAPNWRTVELLKRRIWPILRKKVPKAELHIYGAYATEKVNQLHNPQEGFYIKGRAVDARATIEKYKVLLAPIPFGAGAKGKFVDAMYAGTPSVSSSIGAENMSVGDQWAGYIADEEASFVAYASTLYSEEETWLQAQHRGFELFDSTVADNTPSAEFLKWLEESNVLTLRHNNFMGQILQQQQCNATKYMSLWIEQKNRKGN